MIKSWSRYWNSASWPISISDILKNYFRVLEVIISLNCKLENKSDVGRKQKMSNLEVITLSLKAEFMFVDSENSLFKKINSEQISDLIERSQFN